MLLGCYEVGWHLPGLPPFYFVFYFLSALVCSKHVLPINLTKHSFPFQLTQTFSVRINNNWRWMTLAFYVETCCALYCSHVLLWWYTWGRVEEYWVHYKWHSSGKFESASSKYHLTGLITCQGILYSYVSSVHDHKKNFGVKCL